MDGTVVVGRDELDDRLAFVLGLLGPLSNGKLTRGRLARRLAVVAGFPIPTDPEALEFLIEIAHLSQEAFLRNGRPWAWTEGDLTNFIAGQIANALREDEARMHRLKRAFFEGVTAPSERVQAAYDAQYIHLIPGELSLAIATELAQAGYMHLFGGDWGPAPYRAEVPDQRMA